MGRSSLTVVFHGRSALESLDFGNCRGIDFAAKQIPFGTLGVVVSLCKNFGTIPSDFSLHHAQVAAVDLDRIDASGPQGSLERGDGVLRTSHKKKHVVACLKGANLELARGQILGHALHVQGISEAEPIKAQAVSKPVAYYLLAKGCRRSAGVKRRNVDVGNHYRPYSLVKGGLKGREVEALELTAAAAYSRQSLVAVLLGIAMTREVLHASHYTCLLHAANLSIGQEGNPSRIAPEGSLPDNGVARIGIDVHYG